ncbi:MAG: ribosome small subunit-dependent GTPase A [Bacillaceae bacterium]|nr:ribosome small subunit-dependent GTPase A [Bacillaceae bacterium]
MAKGRIIKALSGYYYVSDENNVVWQCRARGLFKKKGITPLVGDQVEFDPTGEKEGYVQNVLPRKNELIRPPVANIDLAVVVVSFDEPPFNPYLLDKILVHTEYAGIQSLICINKMDLERKKGKQEDIDAMIQLYQSIGYPVITTSAKENEEIEQLKKHLAGKISVFAGPSGVGKSSLLSRIFPGRDLETGQVSTKLKRGRHTTRHVELLPFKEGGAVADTPGFSQLDFRHMEKEELSDCFIDLRAYSPQCKFRGCLHVSEPDCAVQEALENGGIHPERYEHYVQFLQEMNEKKRRY